MDRAADPVVGRLRAELVPRIRTLYRPALVLLFGSRARGDALEDSDLDLIVVSDRFQGVSFIDRAVQFLDTIDPTVAMDVLCHTPGELASKREELGIVSQASRKASSCSARYVSAPAC